jgi:hypothetical protein
MSNWKTSLAGILAAALQAAKIHYPQFGPILDGASAFAVALLGYFAKDANPVKIGVIPEAPKA